jgi:hypothetical protein
MSNITAENAGAQQLLCKRTSQQSMQQHATTCPAPVGHQLVAAQQAAPPRTSIAVQLCLLDIKLLQTSHMLHNAALQGSLLLLLTKWVKWLSTLQPTTCTQQATPSQFEQLKN